MVTASSTRMQELTRRGDDIGSWGARKPGFYQPGVLFDQADRIRMNGYEALNNGRLAEAYVLLLRFTKFYNLIVASKPNKASSEYKDLQRKMLMCMDSLEDIKARLLKQWGDFAAAATVGQAVTEPQDQHLADLTHALESRFQKLKAQPPPKPQPPPAPHQPPPQEATPSPAAASHSAAAIAASATAAAAAAAAGATVSPAAAGVPRDGPMPSMGARDNTGGLLDQAAQPNYATAGGDGASPTPSTHPPPPYPAPTGPAPPASAPVSDPVAAPAASATPGQTSPPGSVLPPPPYIPLAIDPPAAAPAPAASPPGALPAVPPPAETAAGPSAAPAAAQTPAVAPPPAAAAIVPAAASEPSTVGLPSPPDYQTVFANTMYPTIARPLRQMPSGRMGEFYAPPEYAPAPSPAQAEAAVPSSGAAPGVAEAGSSRAGGGGGGEGNGAPPERGMRDRAPGTTGVPARRQPDDIDSGPQDARSRLSRHLALRGFRIMDVPGDNNCQFHALADQLQQLGVTGWSALSLRKKTVQWLQENGNRPMDDGKVGEACKLRDSVGAENWDRYIREMSQHGVTWGDEATLLAASVIFKMEIVVISSLSPDYCHIVTPPDVWKVPLSRRCYLGHFAEFHYVSTRPVGG